MEKPEEDFRIDIRFVGTIAVIHPFGDLNVVSAPKLKQKFDDLIKNGKNKIIVIFKDVNTIDLSGFGVLIGALKQIRAQQGKLAVVVKEMPKAENVEFMFPTFKSEKAALSYIRSTN